jgi:hypothetical protein
MRTFFKCLLVLMAVELSMGALSCPDLSNSTRLSRYHRERLRRHWQRMRDIAGDDGLNPPATWWWNQREAWGFYQGLLPLEHAKKGRITRRGSRGDYRYVLEDTHLGGRMLANSHAYTHQEIFLSTKYKIGYVVVLKSASQAIQKFMKTHFDGDWELWCKESANTFQSGLYCSSQCLDSATHLSGDYLFFSFVQHPVRRFFKAASQVAALPRWSNRKSNDLLASEELWMQFLGDLQNYGSMPDQHLETQSYSLSPPTVRYDECRFDGWEPKPEVVQLQLDFVGRLEELNEDWASFVELANDSRHARGAAEIVGAARGPIEEVRHWDTLPDEEAKWNMWNATMTNEILCLAHEVYAQDIVSFGYGILEGSYFAIDAERRAPLAIDPVWP